MPFIVVNQNKKQIHIVLDRQYRQLKDIADVNNQIIRDTEDDIANGLKIKLDKGKFSLDVYEQQLVQCKEELGLRLAGKAEADRQLERLGSITSFQGSSPCFVISSETTKQELKEL